MTHTDPTLPLKKQELIKAIRTLKKQDFQKHAKKYPTTCSYEISETLYGAGWVDGYLHCLKIREKEATK